MPLPVLHLLLYFSRNICNPAYKRKKNCINLFSVVFCFIHKTYRPKNSVRRQRHHSFIGFNDIIKSLIYSDISLFIMSFVYTLFQWLSCVLHSIYIHKKCQLSNRYRHNETVHFLSKQNALRKQPSILIKILVYILIRKLKYKFRVSC